MRGLPRPLRRRLNRARAKSQGSALRVVHAPIYGFEVPDVVGDAERSVRILSALTREGLVDPEEVLTAPAASLDTLEALHGAEWIRRAGRADTIREVVGKLDAAQARKVLEMQRAAVGGTVLAALTAARAGGIVANLCGGLHHAGRVHGASGCLFNDVGVAVAQLRSRGRHDKVLVLDLDVRDGEGTREVFADDPSVWTLSIHARDEGSRAAWSSTSVALGDVLDGPRYLAALEEALPRALAAQRPEMVFWIAGADSLDAAPSGWRLDEETLIERDRRVLEMLQAADVGATVWLPGEGRGRTAWRQAAAGLIAGLGGPKVPRLPPDEDVTLERFRGRSAVGAPNAGDEHRRFLGHYTAHGLELGLEHYGLLERIRRLGYAPRVVVEHDEEGRDTLFIYGDDSDRELLVELRVHRDTQLVEGLELLAIDWCRLQNPRAVWPGGRRPLPGQQHPGLGMLDDIVALCVLACERIGLDGVAITPSQWHVAARLHGRFSFLEEGAEARFVALQRLLRARPVAEASSLVVAERLIEDGGPPGPGYRPSTLVLAASVAAKAKFEDAGRRARVDERAERARFTVAEYDA